MTMTAITPTYWPFEVRPADQRTEEDWQGFRFFERAHQEGFKPCEYSSGTYKACSARGREGWIIYRGRKRRGGPRQWEVWLVESGGAMVKSWLDDFDCVADAILRWLRGDDMTTSLAPAQAHLV